MKLKCFYKRSALMILMVLSVSSAGAQIKQGFKFGINFTRIDFSTNRVCYNLRTPLGVHFGEFYEIPVFRHLTFFPGFEFSSKGTDYKIDTVSHSLTPTYVEIPANLVLYIGSKTVRISIFAGPYAACAIGGYDITDGNALRYLHFGNKVTSDLRFFDFGLNSGVGINIKDFIISAQVGIGLTDISTENSLVMKNKVIGISLIRSKNNHFTQN